MCSLSLPKHSGKIHNSLKQNLCSCITAATALKRRTHFLPFFWKPLVPYFALVHAYFVLLISAEGGFIMQTPWGWLHSTELMSPDWMPGNGRRVKIWIWSLWKVWKCIEKKNQVKERLNEYMTWASLHPLFLFSWWAMKPMWLVRWILLLPPWARLGRKITRMPDNHSRATAFSSCTPLFSFPPWWRQPPRPHDSAANSTPAGFTVHLAPLHVLLSSPSRNEDLFTTWAHSHDPIVAAVCISRLLAGGKRSGGSVARWWQQTLKWQQSRVLLGFRCSHYRLNNFSVCCKMVLLCVYLHVAD